MLLQLPNPIIFSCLVYWLVGLQCVAQKFFIFLGFMVLCFFSATSLAIMYVLQSVLRSPLHSCISCGPVLVLMVL
jgi:hypothetical protein